MRILGVLSAVLAVGAGLAWLVMRGREPLALRPTDEQSNIESTESILASPPTGSLWNNSNEDEHVQQSARNVVESDETSISNASNTALDSFFVEGRVNLATDAEIEGGITVLCEAQRGNTRSVLATIPVGSDTSWSFGPTPLPLISSGHYRFQLEGANVIPDMVFIEAPAEGAKAWIQLEAKAGIDVWMIVADENEKPLLGAEGVVAWFPKAGMRMERRAKPRDDGMICVRGCPPGVLFLEGHCPGYAVGRLDPLNLPEDPSYTRLITLSRAAAVRGRCVLRGEPVANFDVHFWPTRFEGNKDCRSFADRRDGSFEIDSVPLGEVAFLATSSEYINGATKIVAVSYSGASEIELEVCEPLRGVGQVLDMMTKEPIKGAEIQAYAIGGQGMLPWGLPREVESDGSFDFEGFAPGHTALRVWASGYSVTTADTRGIEGEIVDFGLILIPRRQSLTVRLVSNEPFDPTIYSFAVIGAEDRPEQTFPQSGLLTIPEVSAGKYLFFVHFGESGILRQASTLVPGEEWSLEFPAGGFCRVHIEVVPEPGKDLPQDHYVGYRRQIRNGDLVRSIPLPENGRVEFDGMTPGDVGFVLHDSDGFSVANLAVSIAEQDKELSFTIKLSGAERVVRVLDSKAEPVEGARVILQPPTSESWTVKFTDAEGKCSFPELSQGRYLVNVYHQTLGTRAGIGVDVVNGAEEVIELTLDTTRSVNIRLVQSGQPQEGVPITLYDEGGFWQLMKKTSDVNGLATFASLGEGRYLVRIMDPYWPTDHVIEAGLEFVPTEIEVYGLGKIEFHLAGQGGLPVAEQRIELFCLSLNTDVSEWVEGDRIEAPEEGLVTDVRGLLRLEELPRGDYEWRIPGPTGVLEGLATVVSGDLVRVHITLP